MQIGEKKTCNAKSATAGGLLRDEMYTTDRAGVAIFTYVCDVSSADGGRFSLFRKIMTEARRKFEKVI